LGTVQRQRVDALRVGHVHAGLARGGVVQQDREHRVPPHRLLQLGHHPLTLRRLHRPTLLVSRDSHAESNSAPRDSRGLGAVWRSRHPKMIKVPAAGPYDRAVRATTEVRSWPRIPRRFGADLYPAPALTPPPLGRPASPTGSRPCPPGSASSRPRTRTRAAPCSPTAAAGSARPGPRARDARRPTAGSPPRRGCP